MKKKVSLWIGNVENKAKLDKIMLEVFDEDGDSLSEFMDFFNIDYLDNQFQEVFYFGNSDSKKDIFKDFSYIKSFIEKIPNDIDLKKNNFIILIYDFEYDGNQNESNNIKFIDTFNYVED